MGHHILADGSGYGARALRLLDSAPTNLLLLRQAELARHGEGGAEGTP